MSQQGGTCNENIFSVWKISKFIRFLALILFPHLTNQMFLSYILFYTFQRLNFHHNPKIPNEPKSNCQLKAEPEQGYISAWLIPTHWTTLSFHPYAWDTMWISIISSWYFNPNPFQRNCSYPQQFWWSSIKPGRMYVTAAI